MPVDGVVIHLTTTLGFIDVKGKAVQFSRDMAPTIRLNDVVECEPEFRYHVWVTGVVHLISRSPTSQSNGHDSVKTVVLVADGAYFWQHRRSMAPHPVDFIKVITLLQRFAGVDHIRCFFFHLDPDQWILHTQKTLADQVQRRSMLLFHQQLRKNGIVVKLFGYKSCEVIVDRNAVTGLGRLSIDCAISAQLVESAVLGATDIMLLGGNSDFTPALHTITQALNRATWVIGFEPTMAAELKQFTMGMATYVDLTRHLDALVCFPSASQHRLNGHSGQNGSEVKNNHDAPRETERGHINKVTPKYGFITVGDRGVFFSFDLLPPGWRPSVGDEVECIPILSKQGRWKTDFIRPVHSLNSPYDTLPDPEFEPTSPAVLAQKSRLVGWVEGVVKFLTSEHGFISEITESEHQESRDVWFSLVYAPPEVGLGDSVVCIPSYNKQTKKWFSTDVRLLSNTSGAILVASPTSTPSNPSASTLFVGSLPPGCTRKEVFTTFKTFGRIASIRVVTDRQYGFVNFSSPNSVGAVLQAPPILIRGSAVTVSSYRSGPQGGTSPPRLEPNPADISDPLTHAVLDEDSPLLELVGDPNYAAHVDTLCATLFEMGIDCSLPDIQYLIKNMLVSVSFASFDQLVSHCYEACSALAQRVY